MYKKLSVALIKVRVKKSGKECRSRVKKFHQEYGKIKDKHNLTCSGRTTWKFYV